MARIVYHVPSFPSFQFGGSGGYQPGPGAVYRQRAGGEIQFKNPTWTFRAETMGARDGALKRFGWYGVGVYRPSRVWELSARYDNWDRDIAGENALANALQEQVVGGVTYDFDQTAKVKFNLIYQTFPNIETIPNRVFGMLAFQAAW